MRKFFAADLDRTLREAISGAKFINHPDDQKAIAGAAEEIARYAADGYAIDGITNQKGVLRGFKSLEDCIAEQRRTLEIFPQMQRIWFCPDEGETCWTVDRTGKATKRTRQPGEPSFRKPSAGMFLTAIELYGADFALFVGDMESDYECAEAASKAVEIPIEFQWADDWRQGKREKTVF